MTSLPIGIDNYGLYPLALSALETLDWAKTHEAQGVHFSGLPESERQRADDGYFKAVGQCARGHALYLEWGGGQHIPFDTETWKPRDIFKVNQKAASEASLAGARIVRSCSGGLMRWRSGSPMTETLLVESAKSLRSQKHMLKDQGVILAIETHFEFTTFELVRLFELCEAEPGEWLGICLDTLNLLTMLEDPVRAARRVLPWVVSTHIKDGCISLSGKGLTTFPVPLGKGIVDLKHIIRLLSTLPWTVALSIEDHGGSIDLPVFDPFFLSKFPDCTPQELSCLVQLALNTAKARESGAISMLAREDWPGVCEKRLAGDIQALFSLLSESENEEEPHGKA